MKTMNLITLQMLISELFDKVYIECEGFICFIPSENRWEIHFNTKFKYLFINHVMRLCENSLIEIYYDSFVYMINEIRDKILKEYNDYFNPLWC
jgi:hypothetical protein